MIQRAEAIMRIVRHLNRIAVGAAIIVVATLGAASLAQADGMARRERVLTNAPLHGPASTLVAMSARLGGQQPTARLDGSGRYFRNGDADGGSFGCSLATSAVSEICSGEIEGDLGFWGVTGSAQVPAFVGVLPPSDSAATVDMDYYGSSPVGWDLRSRTAC